jgi:uncharacterized protein
VNIRDEFRVDAPIEDAWTVLLDVERIAPCMPGAELTAVDGDEYKGIVKIKVGPITAQYQGVARILEADEATRTIVIKAEGRDTRGQGNASATVTATMRPDGDATVVAIDTDLNVSGKVAQFGRGVMADVSSKLLAQFAGCLHDKVLGAAEVADATADAGATSSVPIAAEPVDLMRAAGGAVAKRLLPVVGAGVVVVGIVVWLVTR